MHFQVDEIAAGFSAGVVGTFLGAVYAILSFINPLNYEIVGFPLDTIKTRMQTSQIPITKAIYRIYQTDKLLGFFRGIASPMLALTILNTVNFPTYEFLCRYFNVKLRNDIHYQLNSVYKVDIAVTLAGMGVGSIASLISTPLELIKTQVQLDRKEGRASGVIKPKYNGSLHATTVIIRNYGFSSIYIGHGVNTVREVVFSSVYFTSYDLFKRVLSKSESDKLISLPKSISIAIAGGLAGALGWFISFPLDCIKSNIQGQSLENIKNNSHNRLKSWDVFKKLIDSKGIRGLYSGILPSILRAFLVSSSRFSTYEGVKYLFHKHSST